MHTSFEDAVNELTRKHKEFTPEAYYFMREAIDYAAEQLNKGTSQPNLSAKELYLGACAYALEEYGAMARKVLEYWGIYTTQDFSNVVYNLIEAGVFGKQKDDSPSDFEKLDPLENLLNAPFAVPVDIATTLLEKEAEKARRVYNKNVFSTPDFGPNDSVSSRSPKSADKTTGNKADKTAKSARKTSGSKTNSKTTGKADSKATPSVSGKRGRKAKATRDAKPPTDTDSPSDLS